MVRQPQTTARARVAGEGAMLPPTPRARCRLLPRVAAVLLLLPLALVGCAAATPEQTIETVRNRETGPERRIAALGRMGPVEAWPDPEHAVDLLGAIAWSDTQPDDLRIAVMDRLIAHDEAAFRTAAHNWITRVDSWPVMHHLFDTAAARGWTDFTRTAIRSYARASQRYPDAERPERGVIAALNPGRSVEETLLETFVGLEPGVDAADQAAAWTVLNRLASPEEVRAMLASSPQTTPLVAGLADAAVVVDELPRDHEGLLWLGTLRSLEDGAWWQRAALMVEAMPRSHRAGLALRHLPVLLSLEDERLSASRDELLAEVRRRLAGRLNVTRRAEGALPGASSESFDDHADRLAWADLAVIRVMLDAMEDRQLVAQWFVQADADHLDTGTEQGGVLNRENGAFIARGYRPTLRDHDHKFISSDALVEAMYVGLAHYHFHAQQHHNAAYAGPGAGDLAFVERLRPNALVLTFIDRHTLNVDYHQPGGTVIDLGLVYR